MLTHFHKQFAYNAWANRETLASLQVLAPTPPKALSCFCHSLTAERLWHTRLLRQSTDNFVVWPGWTLERCAAELPEVIVLWDAYFASLTPERLLHSILYTNTLGEEWRNTISDVLTHVVIHSGYHRGQVAAEIRKSGGTPAYTDFIHAVRQGFLEKSIPDVHRH